MGYILEENSCLTDKCFEKNFQKKYLVDTNVRPMNIWAAVARYRY